MTEKIALWIRTDKLNTEYTWEEIDSAESFEAKKSIDNQLNRLKDRDDAKSSIQSELAWIKSTKDFKEFLMESEHDKGINKYVSTYANHISIKIWDHEYIFEAEDESTRVAIHKAIVEFFRTQVIESKKKEYQNSTDYATATNEEKRSKKEEIEAEFAKDKFEIDMNNLNTSMAIKSEVSDETQAEWETEKKEKKRLGKLWDKVKKRFKDIAITKDFGSMLWISAIAAKVWSSSLGQRIGLFDPDVWAFVKAAHENTETINWLVAEKEQEKLLKASQNKEPVV